MTDIVERLRRDLASGLSASIGDTKEAAAEIERLRIGCEELRELVNFLQDNGKALSDEVERLRRTLGELARGAYAALGEGTQ